MLPVGKLFMHKFADLAVNLVARHRFERRQIDAVQWRLMDVDLEIGMMILGAEATDIGKRQHPVRFGRIRCLFLSLLAPASLDMPRHAYSSCSMWVRRMSIIPAMSFSSLVFIFMSPPVTLCQIPALTVPEVFSFFPDSHGL